MCNCRECNTTEAESDALSGLHDDRKLNLKMAEVCKLEIRPRDKGLPDDAILYIVDIRGRQVSEPWNPVHNWNEVFDYVVPALIAAGFSYEIKQGGLVGMKVLVCIETRHRNTDRDTYVSRFSTTMGVACRTFCEAAWEAWQQLEKEKS